MKDFYCDVAMLRPLLHKLPLSSATGIDKISAEHLSFADPCIAVYLSLCFNMCLMHGLFPPIAWKQLLILFKKIVMEMCRILLILGQLRWPR